MPARHNVLNLRISLLGILTDADVKRVTARKNIVNVSKWAFFVNQVDASAATVKIPRKKFKDAWRMTISSTSLKT